MHTRPLKAHITIGQVEQWRSNFGKIFYVFLNPRPDGPLDFSPPAGGGGLNTPPPPGYLGSCAS